MSKIDALGPLTRKMGAEIKVNSTKPADVQEPGVEDAEQVEESKKLVALGRGINPAPAMFEGMVDSNKTSKKAPSENKDDKLAGLEPESFF